MHHWLCSIHLIRRKCFHFEKKSNEDVWSNACLTSTSSWQLWWRISHYVMDSLVTHSYFAQFEFEFLVRVKFLVWVEFEFEFLGQFEFIVWVQVSCLGFLFQFKFEFLVWVQVSHLSLSLLFEFEFEFLVWVQVQIYSCSFEFEFEFLVWVWVRVSSCSLSLDQCQFTYRYWSGTFFMYNFGGKLRPVSKSTLV